MDFLKLLLIYAFYMLSIKDTLQNCRQRMNVKGSKKIYHAKGSILKKINPEYSLEGLMLKLQYFGHNEKSWLTGRDPDGEKDWRQEEKGMTEDEMGGWHHWLNGHEFEQAPGDGEGQGGLVSCSPRGCKESDMTKWPNNNSSASGKEKNAGAATLVSEEIGFKTKDCNKRQKGHYRRIKGSIQQEDTFVDISAPSTGGHKYGK